MGSVYWEEEKVSRVERKQQSKQKIKTELLEWVKLLCVSLVAAIVITTFVKPTMVKGESMSPTIHEYDYLIINCMSYVKKEPAFGDIIVFETKMKTDSGRQKDLIKRIIGVPGDFIQVKDGIVYRNGVALEEPYIDGIYTPGDVEEMEIPENHVFVMGDNRSNSLDSRSEELGTIPYEDIVGSVLVRLFPFNKIGLVE